LGAVQRNIRKASILEHHAFAALIIDTYGCIGTELRSTLEGLAELTVRKRPGRVLSDDELATASKLQLKTFLIGMSCTLQWQIALYISSCAAASS
jgi:hypothetical protein